MNILLVYPEIPATFWSFKYALKFIHRRAFAPPLGLLTIAGLIADRENVRLVDMNAQRLGRKDLQWADYVFISAMMIQRESALRVINICRDAGIKTVAGGPLFTHEYESFPQVDYFVLGEAEGVIATLLEDIRAGRPQRIYSHQGYADLTASPMPRFDLVKVKRYAAMCVQYSRGCPYDCEFCDVTALFGRRPRVKNPQQIVDELDHIKTLGRSDHIFFVDDNLIGAKHKFKSQMLPELIKWQEANGPVSFSTQVSIDLADDQEMLDMMARAGFDIVFIGIETPDKNSLTACHKTQNVGRDMLGDIHRIQASGIQVYGGFIVGFDGEPTSIFQRQINFIQSSGIPAAMVGVLQAIKGTRLYQRLQREGRLACAPDGDNVIDTTNFITTMDKNILSSGFAHILRNIYSPKSYYRRVTLFLQNYKMPPVNISFRWYTFRAFCSSLVRLGIFGKERTEYWRLLGWTLLHRPKLFSTAVSLAIIGYHYRRICKKYFSGYKIKVRE